MTESISSTALVAASEYAQSIVNVSVDTSPLNNEQARALTNTIRDAAEVMWILIARAHAGRAWTALGYDTWETYVRSEFNMSRSRSYQLLDQARVIAAIESAAPEGTEIHLTEAAARDLKSVVEDAVPEIRTRTAGLKPEEAAVVIEEIIEEQRTRMEGSLPQKTTMQPVKMGSESDEEIDDELAVLMAQPPGFDEELKTTNMGPSLIHSSQTHTAPITAASPAMPGIDVARVRRNVNAAHDLYSSLSALAGLPEELEEVVAIIPEERKKMIQANLARATENLERFRALWESEKDQGQE